MRWCNCDKVNKGRKCSDEEGRVTDSVHVLACRALGVTFDETGVVALNFLVVRGVEAQRHALHTQGK